MKGCARPLIEEYDVGLLDLDGVVYVGDAAVPEAAETLRRAREAHWRVAYVTNNALRTPTEVAARLTGLGVPASAEEVITSAQAAARVLARRLPAGSKVLVAGGEGLRSAVREAGFVPVASADDAPAAVVCGHDPEQTWARLAEATLAIRSGVPWIASNTDATIPDKRGSLPGAGSIVALLRTAAERDPDEIAGKPFPAMHAAAMERTSARRPLIVGDRLDTDIKGAHDAGVDSLLVLTGVTDARGLIAAPRGQRPTYLAADLRGLLLAHPAPRVTPDGVEVATASARDKNGVLTVTGADRLDRLRAAAVLAWGLAAPPTDVLGLD